MKKVSVIIPVYNGELYLEQCLDSVCNQTLKDIEIICVDDGSIDTSYEILERYQANDDRIQLYQQQNQYAGVARNLGKSHATGEYLIFWDCDDFYERNALELMSKKMDSTHADICVCRSNHYYTDQGVSYPVPSSLQKSRIPKGDTFQYATNEKYILNFTNDAPWNKMYRRSFIEELGLDFQNIRNGNDVYFTANAMCFAQSITTVDKILIHYRKNQQGSLVGTVAKAPTTVMEAWLSVADNLKLHGRYPEQSFLNKFMEMSIYTLRNIRNREAFDTAVLFLREVAFQKLDMHESEEEYYYVPWHAEVLSHLMNASLEEIRDFLMTKTYSQALLSNAKYQKARVQIKKLRKQIKKKNQIIEEQQKLIEELKKNTWTMRMKRFLEKTCFYRLCKNIKGKR